MSTITDDDALAILDLGPFKMLTSTIITPTATDFLILFSVTFPFNIRAELLLLFFVNLV